MSMLISNDFIIPAIDLIDGQCVRLSQGNYTQKKIYNANPVDVAKQFEAFGIKRLHLVDLDGAKAGKLINIVVLEQIASQTNLQIDFGGGIKSTSDVKTVLNAGAKYATIGSIAVKNKNAVLNWFQQFGTDTFLIGCDVKDELLRLHGWTETSNETVFELIQFYRSHQFNHFFCTDISKDGMMQGPGLEDL